MHPNKFKSLIKECIIEVLKEDLTEAFDPTSQGPNPVEENPYVMWNAHMRKLEEDESTNPHGRYAQQASAGQFDPRTFGVNEDEENINSTTLGDINYYIDNSGLSNQMKELIRLKLQGYNDREISKMWFPHIYELPETPRNRRAKVSTVSNINRIFHIVLKRLRRIAKNDVTFGAKGNNQCICKKCQNKFNYNYVPEVYMGFVECPFCRTVIDQEGNPAK